MRIKKPKERKRRRKEINVEPCDWSNYENTMTRYTKRFGDPMKNCRAARSAEEAAAPSDAGMSHLRIRADIVTVVWPTRAGLENLMEDSEMTGCGSCG